MKTKAFSPSPTSASLETPPSTSESEVFKPPVQFTKPPSQRDQNKDAKKTDTKARKQTYFESKPPVLFVGDSVGHNTNFRTLEIVTNTTIKTARAYSSSKDIIAKFPEKNMMDVTEKELEKREFDHLVLTAPTVDITNIDTSKFKPNDDTNGLKEKAGLSCYNMIKIAEDSLKNHPKLKNVTILGHTPRYDSREIDPAGLKPNIAHFANNYLLELWLYSPLKDKIHIGNHNLECSGAVRAQRYTDGRTGRHDGVHMYGEAGKKAYSESLLNVLLTSFQECDPKSL